MKKDRQKIYEKYQKGEFLEINKFSFEKIIKEYDLIYSKFLPLDKESVILDIGCGLGQFLKLLEEKGYKNFQGIDVSQEQIDFCKSIGIDKIKLANVFDFLKNKNEMYDFIIANDIIEHIERDKILDFLSLIYQSLKKQGVLILKTGNALNFLGLDMRYRDFTHEIGFTPYWLKQILITSNFEKTEIFPYIKPLLTKRIIYYLRRFIFDLIYKLLVGYPPPERIYSYLIFSVSKK